MIASAYGDVYVAQIALGADNAQTVKALAEADAHPGPSLVIAYSHCIAHGIEMKTGMEQQKLAVDTGYWPLYRYDPKPPSLVSIRSARLATAEAAAHRVRRARHGSRCSGGAARRGRRARCARAARRRRTLARVRAARRDRARAGRGGGVTVDITTTYLGLRLRSPIVASASPLTGDLDSLRALDDAGIGAAVLLALRGADRARGDGHPILEHATASARRRPGSPSWTGTTPVPTRISITSAGEARGLGTDRRQPERHIRRRLAALRAALRGRRCRCARAERLRRRGRPRALERRRRGADYRTGSRGAQIGVDPAAVKVGPFYSAFAHMAVELTEAGALVLFNRFLQPDIDLETLDVAPSLVLSVRRAPAAAALDSDPPRRRPGEPRRNERCTTDL